MSSRWPFKRRKSPSLGRGNPLSLDLSEEIGYEAPLSSKDTRFAYEYQTSLSKLGGQSGSSTVTGRASWASVKLISTHSHSCCSPQSTGMYRARGQYPIAGIVELTLHTAMTVEKVSIALIGRFTNRGSHKSHVFLDNCMTLWDSWMGNPRLGATNAMGWNPHAQVFSAKLLGSYNWPFEFALAPMHASFHTESIETRFDLPPSFEEERIHAKVEYQLVLTVEGGNPRTNVRLPIPVHYTPDAPSSGRPQRRPQGMMTPMEDPSAWCALPGVQIEGTVVRRRVHAHASLYVGSSLSYATGSFIPCYITIGVDDPLALDILATSQRLVVKLLRKVTYLQGDPTASSTSYRQAKACFKQAEVISECGRAVWVVPPFAPVEHPRTRQFYGEIHLSEDLKPSYSSPILSISYAIQYLSFDCTAFEQANELKVCGVEITENFTGQHSGGFISRCYSNNDQQVKLKDVQGLPSDFSHFSF